MHPLTLGPELLRLVMLVEVRLRESLKNKMNYFCFLNLKFQTDRRPRQLNHKTGLFSRTELDF